MEWTRRLCEWNERMMGLPRKALLVTVTFALAASAFWILPYIWPFAAAFLFSRLLEPFVRFAAKGFSRLKISHRKSRSIAALLGLMLLFGIAGALVTALVSWLFQELAGFLKTLPQLFQWLSDYALPAFLAFYENWRVVLPPQRMTFPLRYTSSALSNIAFTPTTSSPSMTRASPLVLYRISTPLSSQ